MLLLFVWIQGATWAQVSKIELYNLIQKLWMDSTGYSNIGDWDISKAQKIPIKWKEDRIIMSDDTSINFYRLGSLDIQIGGQSFMLNGQPVKWQIMLKGPRMGFSSFSIISTASKELLGKYTLDSLLRDKQYSAKLLKKCDARALAGYYYYQLKMKGKDVLYIKTSWVNVNGNVMIRIDGYDDWSKYAVKLECK